MHASRETWYKQQKGLSERFQIVAINIPGIGKGKTSKIVPRDEILLSILNEKKKLLKDGKVFILGHDLGAAIAWDFADKYSSHVSGIISLSLPHPKAFEMTMLSDPKQRNMSRYALQYKEELLYNTANIKSASNWIPDRNIRLQLQKTLGNTNYNQFSYLYNLYFPYHVLLKSFHKNEYFSEIKHAVVPSLVLLGKKDAVISHNNFRRSCQFVENLCEEIILEGGHDPHINQSKVLNTVLIDWITKIEEMKHVKLIKETISNTIEMGYRLKKGDDFVVATGKNSIQIFHQKREKQIISHAEVKDIIDVEVDGNNIYVLSDFSVQSPKSGKLYMIDINSQKRAKFISNLPGAHRIHLITNNRQKFLLSFPIFGDKINPTLTNDGIFVPKNLSKIPIQKILLNARDKVDIKTINKELSLIHDYSFIRNDYLNFFLSNMNGIHQLKLSHNGDLVSLEKIYNGLKRNNVGLSGSGNNTQVEGYSTINFASIEPVHGNEIVVYKEDMRILIGKEENAEGHSLINLDIDQDGKDELLACFFGKAPGVVLYKSRDDYWKDIIKYRIDDKQIACQDLLVVKKSKNMIEVWAVGSTTHNIRSYKFSPMRESL